MTRVVPQGEVLYPSLVPLPNLVITAPVTGDRWAIGSRQTIRWEGYSNVRIRLLRIGDATVYGMWYQPNGNSLEVDVSAPAGNAYYVQVQDWSTLGVGVTTAGSEGSGIFTIYAVVIPPLNVNIDLLDPASGPVGTRAVLTGTNFGTSGTLVLGGVTCVVTTWTNTRIDFIVPTVSDGQQTLVVTPTGNYVAGQTSFLVGDIVVPPEPTPIYGPTSFTGMVERINDRIDNPMQYGKTERVADGHTRHFYIADRHVLELPPSNPDRLRCFVTDDAVETEQVLNASFDYVSSWYHFDTDPAQGVKIRFDYAYRYVSERMIKELINQAIDYLFPSFYVTHVLDFASSGLEYLVASSGTPADGISDVHTGDEGSWKRLTPFRDYRVDRGDRQECLLHLFSNPSSTVRVRSCFRARHFLNNADTLQDIGLPVEIDECIILYVLWKLQAGNLIPRMRFDQAVVTQGTGLPTVRDQQTTTQIYKMLLDIEVDKRKMRSWVSRGL